MAGGLRRRAHGAARDKRADDFLPKRREHLTHLEGFAYNGYNIITGEDLDPAKDRARRPEARHVRDPYDERLKRMDADGATCMTTRAMTTCPPISARRSPRKP